MRLTARIFLLDINREKLEKIRLTMVTLNLVNFFRRYKFCRSRFCYLKNKNIEASYIYGQMTQGRNNCISVQMHWLYNSLFISRGNVIWSISFSFPLPCLPYYCVYFQFSLLLCPRYVQCTFLIIPFPMAMLSGVSSSFVIYSVLSGFKFSLIRSESFLTS